MNLVVFCNVSESHCHQKLKVPFHNHISWRRGVVWRRGIVVITTAQLYSTGSELSQAFSILYMFSSWSFVFMNALITST